MAKRIPSAIRWTRSDYMKLSASVRLFNKKIRELQKLDNTYLPKELDYKNIKEDILSRGELNRTIKSLNRFRTRETQQRKISLPSGENISAWEYQELKKAQKRGIDTINRYARDVINDESFVNATKALRQLKRSRESIQDLFNREGREFRRTATRTMRWGKSDYDLWRADVFRKNFMYSLEHMKNYGNYNIIYNKLSTINNPIQFYNYLKDNDKILSIFDYYQDEHDANTFGGYSDNQEAFDDAVESLGLTIA